MEKGCAARFVGAWVAAIACIVAAGLAATSRASYIEEVGSPEAPPSPLEIRPRSEHVPEMQRYLDRLEIAEPIGAGGGLVVFPLRLRGGDVLRGGWWPMDEGIRRGILTVEELTERDGPNMATVWVRNLSRTDHVFLMAGEILGGGRQTRAIGHDLIVGPGRSLTVAVFCVEQHRWKGGDRFRESDLLAPSSIRHMIRAGADQESIWREIASGHAELGAANPTGSLESSLKSEQVRRSLDEVRRTTGPRVPGDSTGFILLRYDKPLGIELFGRSDLAGALLPKILDSYAADVVLRDFGLRAPATLAGSEREVAAGALEQLRRAGSLHVATQGAGRGIRTRRGGLAGEGVSLNDTLAHYGCHWEGRDPPRPIPLPEPME